MRLRFEWSREGFKPKYMLSATIVEGIESFHGHGCLSHTVRKLRMDPSQDEGDHGARPAGVDLGKAVESILRAVQIRKRIQLRGGLAVAAELEEGEEEEGVVDELFVGEMGEGELASVGDGVENGAPGAVAGELEEGGDVEAEGVEAMVGAAQE